MGKQIIRQKNNNENGLLNKVLNNIEKVGNKLPDPVTIFMILCAVVFILSAVIAKRGLSVIHPSTKEVIRSINLL